MTRLEDRQTLMRDIAQACAEGARLAPACALAGIAARTLQRWKIDGLTRGPDADRPAPSHALSEAERARIIEVANEPRFAATPPARVIPALADEGLYIASESSFHRVLRAHGQMNRRGRARAPRTLGPPRTHIATRPGEVWCWDVTFVPTGAGPGTMVLSLPDPGPQQSQGRRLRGARHRQRRACRQFGPPHRARRGYACHADAPGAAW
jgi:putative transposase